MLGEIVMADARTEQLNMEKFLSSSISRYGVGAKFALAKLGKHFKGMYCVELTIKPKARALTVSTIFGGHDLRHSHKHGRL